MPIEDWNKYMENRAHNSEQADTYAGVADALRDDAEIYRTDFGDQRTAELDIQFKADTSYGLSKKRFGWYSNDTIFDSTHFSEIEGLIRMETSATGTDTARLRSAYPGTYYPHTPADASMGMRIPSEYLEYDSDERVSLTHGEISAEVVEWNEDTDSGQNAVGFSFEDDGVYIQVRGGNEDTHFVRQEDWNVDPFDGTGPTGEVLEPEDGLIYSVTYSWYGFGNVYFRIYSKETGRLETVHVTQTEGGPSFFTPNMPLQVTVENQGTATPLGADVGGIAFATHGTANVSESEESRTTEIVRQANSGYIDTAGVFDNNALAPFSEAGVPLIAVRRDLNNLESRVSLNIQVIDAFANVDTDVYLIIWDEYEPETALTGQNFRLPPTAEPTETRLQVDTEATDYTPTEANIRGVVFVGAGNKATDFSTGDANTRMPLESTTIMTAVLAPGSNATDAQPAIMEIRESW